MQLDKESISEFLLLGFVLGDKSFIKGEKAKIKVIIPKFVKKEKTSVKDVENALKNSIEKKTKNKKRVGVLLSGGKDARLLLSLAKSLNLDVSAVTVGDIDNRPEEKAAIGVTKALKVDHKLVRIPENVSPDIVSEIGRYTDGLVPFSGITPVYLIRDQLCNDFDVVLSGNLMTEIMDTCELRWYDSKNPVEVMERKHFQGGFLLKDDYLNIAKNNFRSRFKNKSLEEIILEVEYKNRMKGIIALNNLGVPIELPAADEKVVSSTFSLPIKKRMNGRLAMSILKKSYPKVARVKSPKTCFPLTYPWWVHYGTQTVKEKVYYFRQGSKIWDGKPRRYRMGMWDQGFFFKYRIGDYVKQTLEGFEFEMIKPGVVQQILNNHFSEKKDETTYLSKLVTLKNWLDNNS
jgi:asparagine synthetase B (glutamine-hydrolysing)